MGANGGGTERASEMEERIVVRHDGGNALGGAVNCARPSGALKS